MFKGWGKRVGKVGWPTVGKVMWEVLLKNFVEELGKGKLCERSEWQMLLKIMYKKWLARLGWKVKWKNLAEISVEKLYGTIKLTICWKSQWPN